MSTAVEILDWSISYKTLAGDGFKAEMVWLASKTGNKTHAAADQEFLLPEWQAFAHYFMPLKYQAPSLTGVIRSSLYEQKQLEAIKQLGQLTSPSIDLSGNLNEATHSVLWATKFGNDKKTNAEAEAFLVSLLSETLTNDEYAKVVLSLRCLKHTVEYPRIAEILQGELGPETYHEQLCALGSNFLR